MFETKKDKSTPLVKEVKKMLEEIEKLENSLALLRSKYEELRSKQLVEVDILKSKTLNVSSVISQGSLERTEYCKDIQEYEKTKLGRELGEELIRYLLKKPNGEAFLIRLKTKQSFKEWGDRTTEWNVQINSAQMVWKDTIE